jgi:hypothetical protein
MMIIITDLTNPVPARPNSDPYSFLYVIRNFAPLDPDSILQIWRAVKAVCL